MNSSQVKILFIDLDIAGTNIAELATRIRQVEKEHHLDNKVLIVGLTGHD